MSLMIKGFEFPQSCRECWFVYPEGLHNCSCIFTDKYWEFEEEMPSKSRLPECPLVEIPTPHGRLIDADALVNRIKNNYCNKCTAVEECGICVCQNCGVATLFDEIENSTTIIEAEVSE